MTKTEADMARVTPREADADAIVADLLARHPAPTDKAEVLSEFRKILKPYEVRYGLPSDRLYAAVASGELAETLDVCDWMIHYGIFLDVQAR
jgi:hypothetical protein